MKDSNPFAPTQTLAEPAAVVAKQTKGKQGLEIFHNAFRGLLAFLFFGFTPVFVVPQFKNLFEEFGMELPTMAQFVIQFSDLACMAPILFLPLSFVLFAAIECGIFLFPSGTLKTLINGIYWLILVLVIGLPCLTLANIFNAYQSSLTATINLTPHLLRF